MREFFKGWRRKVGCVTLAMACVFMAGWVRSCIWGDTLMIPIGETWYEWLASGDECVVWGRHRCETRRDDVATYHVFIPGGWIDSLNYFEWRWRHWGFGVAENRNDEMTCIVIPYPSIVMALTLLSAYLLLMQSRVAKPQVGEVVARVDGRSDFAAGRTE
jgi:hypothetical protein